LLQQSSHGLVVHGCGSLRDQYIEDGGLDREANSCNDNHESLQLIGQ
jgi:hypothetical protein